MEGLSKGDMNDHYDKLISTFNGMAKNAGYEIVYSSIPMIIVRKTDECGEVVITIYVNNMSVTTVLNHPKKGMTKLLRENCNISIIKKILKDPRVHTPKKVNSTYLK